MQHEWPTVRIVNYKQSQTDRNSFNSDHPTHLPHDSFLAPYLAVSAPLTNIHRYISAAQQSYILRVHRAEASTHSGNLFSVIA